MPDFNHYVDANASRFEAELCDFLRIPSVSTDPAYASCVAECASWVADRLTDAGVTEVEVVGTAGHPIVVGERRVSDDLPTVLIYGHYDVQPSEPDDLWTSLPFDPTVRDGRLFARGAVDDKGQVHMHIKALETLAASGREPSANLKFVIEGEEEIGSRHLGDFLRYHQTRLSCDAVFVSDTSMFSPTLPCITVGLRGIVFAEIRVTGPQSDLHSGAYGGAVMNPANALAAIVAGLRDADGRVTIDGYYDRVRAISDREKADLARLPLDDEVLRAQVGAPALDGEAGFSAVERLWYRPTLDVNGLLSGYTGDGSKTVLPSRAMAKVSMRLVPDQDPAEVLAGFEERVHELTPQGVTVEVLPGHGGAPWVANTDHPVFGVTAQALKEGFGAPPAFIREGGSIPIVQSFEETFGAPAVLVGFALPGCNMHAPDEWIDLGVYRKGIAALAALYGSIGSALP